MGHGRGDHFLLFALIQSVKLTISAEYEDAVNAVGDEAVEKPTQPRQVEQRVQLDRSLATAESGLRKEALKLKSCALIM